MVTHLTKIFFAYPLPSQKLSPSVSRFADTDDFASRNSDHPGPLTGDLDGGRKGDPDGGKEFDDLRIY
jgi:hypothetical protein